MQKQTAEYLDSILTALKEHAVNRMINGSELFVQLQIPKDVQQSLISILQTDTTAEIERMSGSGFLISSTKKGIALLENGGYFLKLKKELRTEKLQIRSIHKLSLDITKSYIFLFVFITSVTVNMLYLFGVIDFTINSVIP